MLEEQRAKIDDLDQQIVALIEERYDAVQEIARIKKENNLQVLDSGREAKVIEKVQSYVTQEKYQETIVEVYQALMDISKKYQQQQIKEE